MPDVKDKTNLLPPEQSRQLRYEEAKQMVKNYIRAQGLRPGDRLPTEAELRRRFGWSRVTLNRALNELEWEGLLKRVQGSGTYVSVPERSKRTCRILVSAWPHHLQDDYCGPLFAGIREEAAAQRVDIVYYSGASVPTVEMVHKLDVDAALALGWALDDLSPILRLHQAGVTVVGLALRCRSYPLPLVCMDNFGGMCRATQYLLDRGHRRIAYATLRLANSDVAERLLAFQYTMAQARLPVDPASVWLSNRSQDVSLLEYWWQSLSPTPTALLLHGSVAAPMLALLQRRGVQIPGRLSVIVIDEMESTRHFEPPLTVLSQSPYQLGRRGLSKLIRMLKGEDDGLPEVLPTEMRLRDSVATLTEEATALG